MDPRRPWRVVVTDARVVLVLALIGILTTLGLLAWWTWLVCDP